MMLSDELVNQYKEVVARRIDEMSGTGAGDAVREAPPKVFYRHLDEMAAIAGCTAEQWVTHIVKGERRHPEAADHECGVISPKMDGFCRRRKGHPVGLHDMFADSRQDDE